ncbi:nucleoside 2-deoxyribosyltransferase [Halioxenophilus sp. WMMB6]|uniref:nucleoside 2-deoxyribosyltransferase n=1 Tax=Halioxenophilus sp. WMMB6 TaxID=3073815 RepID=UPI00295E5DBC|nr:nucleoside 2-deoxyribosyltransferase [Halioxenophilus sp. WMMB6]
MTRSMNALLAVCPFIFGLLLSFATVAEEKPTYYIYLAGPEVFLSEPVAAGAEKKQMIEAMNSQYDWPFRLEGLYPLDNEIPDFKPDYPTGIRIYQANIAQMNKAHFILANMVRFRGPSMDVGTAFEMGYASGLGKPVFAYYEAKPFYGAEEEPGVYNERVVSFFKLKPGANVDPDGISIESFAMSDNLMMIGALDASGATINASFEETILAIADYLKSQR